MPSTPMAEFQMEVRTMMEAGRAFSDVEDRINEAPGLSDDERSALWLLAWSYIPPARQREVAVGHIRALAEMG